MPISVPKKANLSQIAIPGDLPSIIDRLFNDWRGLYSYCKTRRLSIHVLDDELLSKEISHNDFLLQLQFDLLQITIQTFPNLSKIANIFSNRLNTIYNVLKENLEEEKEFT